MQVFRFLAPVILALGLFACAPAASPTHAGSAEVNPCPQRPPLVTVLRDALTFGEPAPLKPGDPVAMEIGEIERFCNEPGQAAVLCDGTAPANAGVKLTSAEVARIDASVRKDFFYTSDDIAFGSPDRWANDVRCGDCEDYALVVSERLAAAGQDGAAMALMIWVPNWQGGHATLLVDTSDVGMLEIGVSPTEGPRLYSPGPVRLGFVVMDGRLEIDLFPGVSVWREGGYILIGHDALNPTLPKPSANTP